jgi:hypothetical protein
MEKMGTEVVVWFAAFWKSKMKDGRKTTTWRTERLGYSGDWFSAFGSIFRIRKVWEITYGDLVKFHYRTEGCETEGELRAIFRLIWRGKEPAEDRVGWIHDFYKEYDLIPGK